MPVLLVKQRISVSEPPSSLYNHTIMKPRCTRRSSLSGKIWLRDENRKGTMGCASGWGCRKGKLVAGVRKEKRGAQEACYSAGRTGSDNSTIEYCDRLLYEPLNV